MKTQTNKEPLIPLWIISAYDKIEEDITETLGEYDAEYREIVGQTLQMEGEYPFIGKLAEGRGAVEMSEEEHEIYNRYLSLCFDKESKERQYYYWMGHRHSLDYLKKAGFPTGQEI